MGSYSHDRRRCAALERLGLLTPQTSALPPAPSPATGHLLFQVGAALMKGQLLETAGSNHHDVISAAALPSCPDSTSKGINTENHIEAGKGTLGGTLLLWPDPQRVCRPLLHVAYHTHQRTLGQAQPCSLDRKGSVHCPWADPSCQPCPPAQCWLSVGGIWHCLEKGDFQSSQSGGCSWVEQPRMHRTATMSTVPRAKSSAGWSPWLPLAPGCFHTSGLHLLVPQPRTFFPVHCSLL